MAYTKLTADDFIMQENDGGYNEYSLSAPVKIFGTVLSADDIEEMDDCFRIAVDEELDFDEILPLINEYIEWLGECGKDAAAYFEEHLEEELPPDWLETIELYEVYITFDGDGDYGATVRFAESVFPDHIVEFTIDGREIVDDFLDG